MVFPDLGLKMYGSRESNPGRKNGNLTCYHYTTTVGALPFPNITRLKALILVEDLQEEQKKKGCSAVLTQYIFFSANFQEIVHENA